MMKQDSFTKGQDEMGPIDDTGAVIPSRYVYEAHVKFVGIVEIVLQVLLSICVFSLVCVLSLGSGALLSYSAHDNDVDIQSTTGNGIHADAAALSGIMIAGIVILILIAVFHGWLVHLVYYGGQKKNAGRLNLWYIIQSVFTAISILKNVVGQFGGPLWCVILNVGLITYRIYSIHVVRCHAYEIKKEENGYRNAAPGQI